MTTIATAFYEANTERNLGEHITENVKNLVKEILFPQTITRELVEKYFRKAVRLRAWYKLKPIDKALILALRRFNKSIRSRVLVQIIKKILLEIELQTIRGKALLYGSLIAMGKLGLNILGIIKEEKEKVYSLILYLGISYLNDPLMYRILG